MSHLGIDVPFDSLLYGSGFRHFHLPPLEVIFYDNAFICDLLQALFTHGQLLIERETDSFSMCHNTQYQNALLHRHLLPGGLSQLEKDGSYRNWTTDYIVQSKPN